MYILQSDDDRFDSSLSSGASDSESHSDSPVGIPHAPEHDCRLVLPSDKLPDYSIGAEFVPMILRPVPPMDVQRELGTVQLWKRIAEAKSAVRRLNRERDRARGFAFNPSGYDEFRLDVSHQLGHGWMPGERFSLATDVVASATWKCRGSDYQQRYKHLALMKRRHMFMRQVRRFLEKTMLAEGNSNPVIAMGIFDIWFDQACERVLSFPFWYKDFKE